MQPGIVALLAVQLGLDRAVAEALDLDAAPERLELDEVDLAEGADTVAAQPGGRGMGQDAGKAAIVRQKEKALGVEVEPAHRDDPGKFRRQDLEHRGPALGVLGRGHEAARLVVQPEPRAFAGRHRLAVDRDLVVRADIERGRQDRLAIHGDAARLDPGFGIAARGEAGTGHDLGDAGAAGIVRIVGGNVITVCHGSAYHAGA